MIQPFNGSSAAAHGCLQRGNRRPVRHFVPAASLIKEPDAACGLSLLSHCISLYFCSLSRSFIFCTLAHTAGVTAVARVNLMVKIIKSTSNDDDCKQQPSPTVVALLPYTVYNILP
eukprot:GHVU01064820.1.p1 GENE.GHVU01064820.1~~GHVU01064820.1.p1  ORF type:complete len:116 (-),score=4.04 GHVU01064820.1:39-386(-)